MRTLTPLLLLTLIACSSSVEELTEEPLAPGEYEITGPEEPVEGVRSLEFSNCVADCPTESTFDYAELNDGVLTMQFGMVFNCSWNRGSWVADYEIEKDGIRMKLDQPHTMVIEEDGSRSYIEEADACDCFYYVDVVLENIQDTPKWLIVNNEPMVVE